MKKTTKTLTIVLLAILTACLITVASSHNAYAAKSSTKPATKPAIVKLQGNAAGIVRIKTESGVMCAHSSDLSALSESIPCCKSDSQGCICSSDDCDDCKDVTRDSLTLTIETAAP